MKIIEGLIPAVIQHAKTGEVLMLGYMNQAALEQTVQTRLVTFFSRSKNRIWVKGESSGNHLDLIDVQEDCDQDALLVRAIPRGPTCHNGTTSCWGNALAPRSPWSFLSDLQSTIDSRFEKRPANSYVSTLIEEGLDRMAQKVGEEGVETVIAAKNPDDAALVGEAADLLFHLTVLLRARGLGLSAVVDKLKSRHAAK
jgi:phosphoribosyl-ATP pyrophosphohydrolase/phosphoribosyl-AMP cyclohydrolase